MIVNTYDKILWYDIMGFSICISLGQVGLSNTRRMNRVLLDTHILGLMIFDDLSHWGLGPEDSAALQDADPQTYEAFAY
jgi:hypothetical protein